MDSIGGEVDDEINATAEVRYISLFVLFAWCLLFILLTVSHFCLWFFPSACCRFSSQNRGKDRH